MPESGLSDPEVARQWGEELARLHRITPQHAPPGFPPKLPRESLDGRIGRFRRRLDAIGDPQPVLEWVMRQLEREAPEGAGTVLCHGAPDNSSCVVDNGKLLAILDWQWSRWGDPHEDLGEACAACRQYVLARSESATDTAKRALLAGYGEHSPLEIDTDLLRHRELVATLGRAVAVLEQGHRFVPDGEISIELALQSRRVAELEIDLLAETDRLAMEHAHA